MVFIKILNIKRNYTNNNDVNKAIFNIIESELDLKLNQLYNQQQADTVTQNSNSEGRVS